MAQTNQNADKFDKNKTNKNIVGKNTDLDKEDSKFNTKDQDWKQDVSSENSSKGFKNAGADAEMQEAQDTDIAEEGSLSEEGQSKKSDKGNDYNRRRAS